MSPSSTSGKVNDGFPIVVCCGRVVGPWIQEEPEGVWFGRCVRCARDFVFDDHRRIDRHGINQTSDG